MIKSYNLFITLKKYLSLHSAASRDSHRLRSALRTNYHCVHWGSADYKGGLSSLYKRLMSKTLSFSWVYTTEWLSLLSELTVCVREWWVKT